MLKKEDQVLELFRGREGRDYIEGASLLAHFYECYVRILSLYKGSIPLTTRLYEGYCSVTLEL